MHAVRYLAMLLGPPAIWVSERVTVPASVVSAEDVAHWPYTTGLVVEWVAFFDSLHWPVGGADLGLVGFLMLRCSFCMNFKLGRG